MRFTLRILLGSRLKLVLGLGLGVSHGVILEVQSSAMEKKKFGHSSGQKSKELSAKKLDSGHRRICFRR
jgi:hypothetical protein